MLKKNDIQTTIKLFGSQITTSDTETFQSPFKKKKDIRPSAVNFEVENKTNI